MPCFLHQHRELQTASQAKYSGADFTCGERKREREPLELNVGNVLEDVYPIYISGYPRQATCKSCLTMCHVTLPVTLPTTCINHPIHERVTSGHYCLSIHLFVSRSVLIVQC